MNSKEAALPADGRCKNAEHCPVCRSMDEHTRLRGNGERLYSRVMHTHGINRQTRRRLLRAGLLELTEE